uniref:Dehydroquinate dehydratase/shikimate:NADP oxidoreductase n=1 Tax=Diospyros kaki TaxID=35925 RepID=C8KH58_DIOKA|nr:dehydroquinate dehydratase/shikimate:NADP oxidoreductase [Diospyros kaki]
MICAPVMAETAEQMLGQMRKAKELGADLVEIRIDYLKSFSPQQHLEVLIKQSPLPTIITYRPTWEGGQYDGDESRRQATLHQAMELGADYIDIELKVADEFFSSIQERSPKRPKVIVSSHNYENTPSAEEIGNIAARIQATGADIVKIATTALDITDSARILQLIAHSQVPTIGLAMGERGLISRILCAKFGGFLTFGALESGIHSAPGQPTLRDLLDLYNFRQIEPDTKVHGVIGNPIGHSKSPHLYNTAFKKAAFNGIYLPLLVDNVANFLNTYSSPDFTGYSYTIPHKMAGLECCDEVDPIAKAIGAISCMIKKPSDGKLIGYNVDYLGAIAAIEEGLGGSSSASNGSVSPLAGRLFVVIGAGGAAKALAYGGKEKGARVVVANRTYEKAKDLARKIGGESMPLTELNDFHPEDGMILANATSVGMKPNTDATPISKEALSRYSLVFDAIYTPKWTRLLREAKETGAKVVFGTEMFLNQAFVQFEKFTGLPAPKDLIRETLARNT